MRILKFVLLFFFVVFVLLFFLMANRYSLFAKIDTPVSILLLGKGGVGHEAPDLTDTMMLVNINNEKISIISLPRDIWVPEIRAKLNSAYYWGKEKSVEFELVDDAVNSITGITPNYHLVIDFSIFKDFINAIGGIEVVVQNEFTDKKYPIAGKEADPCIPCRYETLRFQEGKQNMNGDTALKFVRSRNAEGDEGTDFAREARQQLVLNAIKNKVLSREVFLSPQKINAVRATILNSIETDVPQNLFIPLARKGFLLKDNINFVTFPESMLTIPRPSPKYDNLYVLIPKTGDWQDLQKWVKSITD